MDLSAEYDRLAHKYKVACRKLEELEDDGHYGSPAYDKLLEETLHLEADLEAIETEIER